MAKTYFQKSLEIAEQVVKKNPKWVNSDFHETVMREIAQCSNDLKEK